MGGRPRLVVGAIASGLIGMGACTPVPAPPTTTTTTMPVSPTPQILSFTATNPSAPAPLTTALQWSISGPAGSTLTCTLDLEDDGTPDRTITPCTNSSIRSVTYPTAGARTVRLGLTDGATPTSATVLVNATAPSSDTYTIDIRFGGSPTLAQQAAFDAAAARWSQVIRTGLADLPVDITDDPCGLALPSYTGTIDDLLIESRVVPIDGVGGTLAQAGPCLIRNSNGLPIYGVMQFDSDDLAGLEASGQLQAVITHEMGHVIGFGIEPIWGGLLVGRGSGYPDFVGPVARGAWNAIGGSGHAVPVEGFGGPGTADSHWRESVFDTELMTGYINGASNPLSAVTIGSLADVGYGVDLAAADPFGTPAVRRPGGAGPEQLRVDLIEPARGI